MFYVITIFLWCSLVMKLAPSLIVDVIKCRYNNVFTSMQFQHLRFDFHVLDHIYTILNNFIPVNNITSKFLYIIY